MKTGDFVVFPCKRDRHVHIGVVDGGYKYDPSIEQSYPNLRPIKWLKTDPRTQFSQGALYEIGSAMSLFQVRNYADEYLAAIKGKLEVPPADQDDTIKVVAEEIEETTRDFILKRLAQELKGHPFAEFISHILKPWDTALVYRRKDPMGGLILLPIKMNWGLNRPLLKCR